MTSTEKEIAMILKPCEQKMCDVYFEEKDRWLTPLSKFLEYMPKRCLHCIHHKAQNMFTSY